MAKKIEPLEKDLIKDAPIADIGLDAGVEVKPIKEEPVAPAVVPGKIERKRIVLGQYRAKVNGEMSYYTIDGVPYRHFASAGRMDAEATNWGKGLTKESWLKVQDETGLLGEAFAAHVSVTGVDKKLVSAVLVRTDDEDILFQVL